MTHNGIARRSLPSLVKSLVAVESLVRSQPSCKTDSVHNVLITECLIPLGNCVHMTPVFEAIKRARPNIRVSVATWGIGAQVLRNSPFVDDLIQTPNPLAEFRSAVFSLRRQLRARNLAPDCCLTGVADTRTKAGLFALAACGGWRGGYTLHPALYQRPLVYDRYLSLIENNLRLAGLLRIDAHSLEPKIFYSHEDAAVARKLLEPARAAGRPALVAVTQNSGGLPTAWHDDRWAQTLLYAYRKLGYEIFYVGTERDGPAISKLKEISGRVGISLAGMTTVNQLAAFIALSDMAITLNTGTMHVARAVGTPMVVLDIAWEKPLQWMPSPRREVRLLRGPDLDRIPPGYRMDEISVEWASSELADMTRRFPPDHAAREARLNARLSEVDHFSRSTSRER